MFGQSCFFAFLLLYFKATFDNMAFHRKYFFIVNLFNLRGLSLNGQNIPHFIISLKSCEGKSENILKVSTLMKLKGLLILDYFRVSSLE